MHRINRNAFLRIAVSSPNIIVKKNEISRSSWTFNTIGLSLYILKIDLPIMTFGKFIQFECKRVQIDSLNWMNYPEVWIANFIIPTSHETLNAMPIPMVNWYRLITLRSDDARRIRRSLYIEDEHKKRRYRRISFTTYFHWVAIVFQIIS